MALLAGGLLCVGMGQSLFFALLPPLARDLGFTEVQVSSIFTLSAILWVFMSPFWGRRSDIWGRKPVILLGLTGFGISTGGFGVLLLLGNMQVLPLFQLFAMMIFIRGIFGFFGSGAPAAAQAYIADRTTRAERTSGVAAIGAAFGMGTVFGPGFAAALAAFHLLAPFFALASLAFISVIAIALFLPERRKPKDLRKGEMKRLAVTDKRIIPFLFMGTTVSLIQAAIMQVAAFFVMDRLGLTAAQTAQTVGIGMMNMAMATLFAQLVIIPRMSPSVRTLLTSGAGISALGTAVLLLPMSEGLFAFALLIQGLGFGLLRPAVAAGASLAVAPEEQGAAAGLIGSTAAIGVIFVPILIMPLYLIMPTAPFMVALGLIALMYFIGRASRIEELASEVEVAEFEDQAMSRPDRHAPH